MSRQIEEDNMEQYQWGIKVTMLYLDGHGGIDPDEQQPAPELRACSDERQARARYEAVADTIEGYKKGRKPPKYQRLGAVELIRRPVGSWETVESA
jgi:hypothetical protein